MTRINLEDATREKRSLEFDERDFNFKFRFAENEETDLYDTQNVINPAPFLVELLPKELEATADLENAAPPLYSEVCSPFIQASTVPRMNILMLAIGSLDEVVDFVAFAHFLKSRHGHRVRLGSHAQHRGIIEDQNIEFFCISSTFKDMEWSNLPSRLCTSNQNNDTASWRKNMIEVLCRSWKACTEPSSGSPFIADTIIASPLCFSHIHCAEKLGIPLFFFSRMPWMPVSHSAADILSIKSNSKRSDNSAYVAVEKLFWRMMGDDINRFRRKTLGLEPMDLMFGPGLIDRLKIPGIYTQTNPMTSEKSRSENYGATDVYVGDPQHDIEAIGAFFNWKIAQAQRFCYLTANQLAYWRVAGLKVQLSSLAVATLVTEGLLDVNALRCDNMVNWDLAHRPWDPLTGLTAATSGTLTAVFRGVSRGPTEAYKHIRSSRTKTLKRDMDRRKQSISVATEVCRGVGDIMIAGLQAPVSYTYGLARGFQNVPILYGDTAVREPDNITGWESGARAAIKGFGYGLYDSVSGFVMQPVRGAQTGGTAGFAKGVGKGLGGLVFKPAAGACGLPGYAFKGIFEEVRKLGKDRAQEIILAARIADGEDRCARLTAEQRTAIVDGWNIVSETKSTC